MRRNPSCHRPRLVLMSFTLSLIVLAGTPSRSKAETLLDMKTLFYQEDNDRIQVIAPMAAIQKEWDDGLIIRVEGIYNSISGATPTGAPPAVGPLIPSQAVTKTKVKTRPDPIIDDDDGRDPGEDDEDDDKRITVTRKVGAKGRSPAVAAAQPAYDSVSGATPPPPPPPPPPGQKPKPGKTNGTAAPAAPVAGGEVPMADFDDTRVAGNLDISYRMGRHTPSVALSYSDESDYVSRGVALKDAIDFNKKNTTLLMGVAGTFDEIMPSINSLEEDKTTVDLLLGVTQVLNPVTLANLSLTVGRTDGYLSDPYKVVELNGYLVPEQRPDTKDKVILYGSLLRYFELLRGSLEGSYRYYSDSFGIDAHTASLAWYQKIGDHWVVRPIVRYYMQSEADFYGVRFTGSPDEYSSDYRLSEMDSFGGGVKLIWTPNSRVSFDISYERYEQSGQDGVTSDDLYPAANMIMVGARLWF